MHFAQARPPMSCIPLVVLLLSLLTQRLSLAVPALVLQATNAGMRRPGNEARVSIMHREWYLILDASPLCVCRQIVEDFPEMSDGRVGWRVATSVLHVLWV